MLAPRHTGRCRLILCPSVTPRSCIWYAAYLHTFSVKVGRLGDQPRQCGFWRGYVKPYSLSTSVLTTRAHAAMMSTVSFSGWIPSEDSDGWANRYLSGEQPWCSTPQGLLVRTCFQEEKKSCCWSIDCTMWDSCDQERQMHPITDVISLTLLYFEDLPLSSVHQSL